MVNGKEIEPFKLPRLDWHDEEGRINKTALIQNFNAIEAKLIELSGVSAIGILNPDWSSIDIPDATLDSDENSVLNLKSFIDIMGLKNFPITIKFNGTRLIHLAYYDNNYSLVNIRDVKIADLGENNKNWVYLKLSTKEVVALNNIQTSSDYVLIGNYFDGMVLHPKGINICDINILEPLAHMTSRTWTSSTIGTNSGNMMKFSISNRVVGYARRHDHTTNATVTYRDVGF